MAKRSQRRTVRNDRDQSGCMWSLISIFDFRHGRTTQKLLSDRRRGSRHSVGAGIPKNLDILANVDDNCEGTFIGVGSTGAAVDSGKPSVKKLIEEEMSSEQDREINNDEVESKQSNAEDGCNKRKNHKRRSRSLSKSCEIHIEDLDVSDNLGSEWTCLQNSEKQYIKSLDMGEIMEEFCCQIHQKSVTCMKHDQHGELDDQPNQKNPEFEEKLNTAIKLFISQKLINGNHIREDGDIHSPKELMNALQILSSDEELFLKLLQGPESVMVTHIQNLWKAQVEKDRDSKSFVGCNLAEQKLGDLKQSDEVIHCKQRKFFRRKAKSLEENPSKGDEASRESNRIVILKPGPTGLQNSKAERGLGSSPQSRFVISNKEPNKRTGSHFFLTEIGRKLKLAMGKERQIPSDGISKTLSHGFQSIGDSDKGFKENVGRNSPSKDHFFIEKIGRPPLGVKEEEKIGKLKECESKGSETAHIPKKRVSNIYVEARKHLFEMLSNGSGDADYSGSQVPKSLGRILSLPEYNFSPMGSPGRDMGQNFSTTRMKFTANDKSHKQESNVSHLGQTTLNLKSQSCVSDDSTDKEKSPLEPNSCTSSELVHDNGVEKTFSSAGDEMTSEGDMEIVKNTEIAVHEEVPILDNLSEQSSFSITRDDQGGDMHEVSDEERCLEHLKHDSRQENQLPSSPLTSPTASSITKKVEDTEAATETPERPSPVSVLEPLFTEDDISPASIRSQSVELPTQPLKIQFEEHGPSAVDQCILKTCTEDKVSIFKFVKEVLQATGVNWDEFYIKSQSSDQLLDPSTFDEAELFSNHLCCDKKLLFDCINEVLVEVYDRYFGCFLGLSFVKPIIRPLPDMRNAIYEVWEGVCWHLRLLPLPHTLDQIVKKDMAKTGRWMDLRCDAETIIVGISEAIFEDLMGETMVGLVNESSESRTVLIPVELREDESNTDL